MSIKHTIRSVSETLDRAVRQRARSEGQSILTVLIEALTKGMDMATRPAEHSDLDHLIGTWQEDSEFDQAVVDFGRIDKDAWM